MPNTQWDQKKQQLDAALQSLTSIGGAPDATPDARATKATEPTGTAVLAASPPHDPARTLMRLVVGTALLGWDELARRAPEWERQATLGTRLPEAMAVGDAPMSSAPAPAETHEQTRRALIGWIFATQDRLREAHDPAQWLQSAVSHIVGTTMTLAGEALGDIRRARTAHVDDPTVAGWIVLGRAEEQRSRTLARVALREMLKDVLDALSREPAIQELIMAQSGSLASDVLGEVRERTVSADLFVDTIVRRLWRRAPAQALGTTAVAQSKE